MNSFGQLVASLRVSNRGSEPAGAIHPDALARLYQVNVRLPGSNAGTFTSATGAPIAPPLTAAVNLPVVVTARNRSSQPGVTIAVAPRLKLVGPAAYHYAVTSGALPAGLTLDSASGAISGTPAAAAKGSYVLTVTAADSAANPVTGTLTFTLTID